MVKRSVSTHAIVGFLFMLGALLAALGCGGNLSSHSDMRRVPVWKQNAPQLAGDAANPALGERRLLFLDNEHLLVAMERQVTRSEGAPALFTLTLQVLDAQSGQRVYGPLKLSAQMACRMEIAPTPSAERLPDQTPAAERLATTRILALPVLPTVGFI
jgi:hypothetical protein